MGEVFQTEKKNSQCKDRGHELPGNLKYSSVRLPPQVVKRTSSCVVAAVELLCVCASHSSRVWLFATLWTVAHQVPVYGILQARIMEWYPPPGDLPDPGAESTSLTSLLLASVFFTTTAIRVRPQLEEVWPATVYEVVRVGHDWTSGHAYYWRELG